MYKSNIIKKIMKPEINLDKNISELVVTENHEDPDIPEINISLDESTYEACIVNNTIYGGMINVPEKDRGKGIGKRLVRGLIEFAKEKNINDIIHNIQSLPGLILINSIKMRNRKFYFQGRKEVSYLEAQEILRKKISDNEQDDTKICIQSITAINQLENE